MIPKVIHYCWFGGGEKPNLVKKCIASWKKYCPDYEIIEWNENNCDISSSPLFIQQAASVKKWGFVSDFFRLKIISENGGIYFDTDVELIRNPDFLLTNKAFFGFHGNMIATGLGFGSEPGFKILSDLMNIYDNEQFIFSDGTLNINPCTVRETPVFIQYGLIQNGEEQIISNDVHIYPKEYFDPGAWGSYFVFRTKNTVSIHHYMSSWYSKEMKHNYQMIKLKDFFNHLPNYLIYSVLGREKYNKLRSILKH